MQVIYFLTTIVVIFLLISYKQPQFLFNIYNYIKNNGKRLYLKRVINNRREDLMSFDKFEKTSKIVLSNNYNLNEYLLNDENMSYINKFKIRHYKKQLKALKIAIESYLRHTNGRISVEHVIMLQEIKEKLKENGFSFKHRFAPHITSNIEDIRSKQIESLSEDVKPKQINTINDDLIESYKNEYLTKHCLLNETA